LNRDMCKFESSQKDESRWQSADSSKAYRNTSAFKCRSSVVKRVEWFQALGISEYYNSFWKRKTSTV